MFSKIILFFILSSSICIFGSPVEKSITNNDEFLSNVEVYGLDSIINSSPKDIEEGISQQGKRPREATKINDGTHFLDGIDFNSLKSACNSICDELFYSILSGTITQASTVLQDAIKNISIKYGNQICSSTKNHQPWIDSILSFPNALQELYDLFIRTIERAESFDEKDRICQYINGIIDTIYFYEMKKEFEDIAQRSGCNSLRIKILRMCKGHSRFKEQIIFFHDEFYITYASKDFEQKINEAILHEILEYYAQGGEQLFILSL